MWLIFKIRFKMIFKTKKNATWVNDISKINIGGGKQLYSSI